MAQVNMPESLNERFPGNSNKDKRAREEASIVPEQTIQSGGARLKKKSEGSKILNALFGNDDAKSVGSYILYDVLIPAAKDMIFDSVMGGLSMRLFGTDRGYSRMPRRTMTNYQGISQKTRVINNPSRPTHRARSVRSKIYNDDIEFDNKAEAYQALDILLSEIEKNGYATIATLYQYCQIPSDYVDNNIGWTDLSDVRIRTVGSKAVMILPPAYSIDDLPF